MESSVDSDTDEVYLIQYDSVVLYVDKNALNYNQYQLPASPVPPPS